MLPPASLDMSAATVSTASAPADLDRISFLDLPAEVRNTVYSELFEHVDPILVTTNERHSGRVTLHRRQDDRNDDLPRVKHPTEERLLTEGEAHPLAPCDTLQSYQTGLSLFRVCQQLHAEASSIFYSNNTFLITRKRIHHVTEHGPLCHKAKHVLCSWFEQIGTGRTLLRKLHVNLNTLCRQHCESDRTDPWGPTSTPRDLDVSSILIAVWKYRVHVKMSIIDASEHKHGDQVSLDCYEKASVSIIVNKLCKDELGIARFWRTLGEVTVEENEKQGSITYWTTSNHGVGACADWCECRDYTTRDEGTSRYICVDTRSVFSIVNDKEIHWKTKSAPAGLSMLPHYLITNIANAFLEVDTITIIDLNSEANFSTMIVLPYISYKWRELSHHLFDRAVILKMTCKSAPSQICSAPKIEQLMDTRLSDSLPWGTWPWLYGRHCSFSFRIEVSVDHPVQLEDIRLQIMPFIIATSSTWSDRQIIIEINAPETTKCQTTVRLGFLRRTILKTLEKYAGNQVLGTRDLFCPDVWVNGLGSIEEVNTRHINNLDSSGPTGSFASRLYDVQHDGTNSWDDRPHTPLKGSSTVRFDTSNGSFGHGRVI
ncbi:hypothetical protein FB567DRAFT_70062 [Paraphoma chrysanthemicola]|uniref:DUF7730 domain-containing protein n=1 Tax=Paraphoma chrysanthemicola TaxID=798071 RepID=A0A8K0R4I6_9PLEO|nr:hypothetical protein FB567DRAFT_70062 [Paraphoma chrysanthemicola]